MIVLELVQFKVCENHLHEVHDLKNFQNRVEIRMSSGYAIRPFPFGD